MAYVKLRAFHWEKDLKEALTEWDREGSEDIMLYDGLQLAFLGVLWNPGPPRAVYSENLIIKLLMERDGMEYDEAQEFYEFNIACLHVGPNTPLIIETFEPHAPPSHDRN